MVAKKYRVATIFVDLDNIHLIKDPGMIPLTLHRYYGYLATIPISSEKKYDYKEAYFQNIEMPRIKDNKNVIHNKLARLKWLIVNAKNIDLLHLFFFDRWTWINIWVYKMFNPKGIVYVHVDTDGERLLYYQYPKNHLKKFLFKKVLLSDKNLDDTLWGIQNSVNVKKLEGVWPFTNIKYVPNGVYWENNLRPRYEEKENIILTVARVGSPEKNDDKLIECFNEISNDFPNWRLRLVGPIEESFKPFLRDFFEKNPEMEERIELPGAIYDRNELEREYVKAKVFCLPSSYESFGIVSVEALSKGCYLLESDILSNVEITQNGSIGMLFQNGNWKDLTEKMKYILLNERQIAENFGIAIEYANEHFTWNKVLEPVDKWAKEKWEKNK